MRAFRRTVWVGSATAAVVLAMVVPTAAATATTTVAAEPRPGPVMTNRQMAGALASADGVTIVKGQSGPSCSGYSSNSVPPSTIRVLRYAGHNANGEGYNPIGVVTVPFRDYVKDVLPSEWLASWNGEAHRAGAIAIKNYAWFWVNHYGGYYQSTSNCFDVTDDTYFQRYIPGNAQAPTSRAVDDTWNVLARRSGAIFQASYKAYLVSAGESCGAGANGSQLSQYGSQSCAQGGLGYADILRRYYSGIEVTAGGGGSVSGDATADLLVHNTSGLVQLRQNITRADGSHYFNDGPTLTQGWGNFLGQSGQGRLYFADVTGDGDADLLVHNTSGLVQLRQNITRADGSHYFNDGPTLTQGWGNFLGQSGQGRLYFADVTGDGDADLLVHNTSGLVQLRENITRADGSHYFNDGPTLTQGWGNFLGQSGQGRLYFADVTGDGEADLLVHNTSGLVQLRENITRADGSHYFNDGPTLTQGWGNFLGQSGQGRLYFADVTGDGEADLLVHNTSGLVQLRENITRADGSHYFNDGPTLTQGWGNFLGQAGQGVLYFG